MNRIFFFLLMVCSLEWASDDRFIKLASIQSPDRIYLSNFMANDLKRYKIRLQYSYFGENSIPNTNITGRFSCSRSYEPDMMMLYITGKGEFLPLAFDFYRHEGNTASLFDTEIFQGDIQHSRVFKNDGSNVIEIYLFDPFLSVKGIEKEEIYNSIQLKEISEVLIIIKEIKIYWEIIYPLGGPKSREQIAKGDFILPINRVVRIPVVYTDK